MYSELEQALDQVFQIDATQFGDMMWDSVLNASSRAEAEQAAQQNFVQTYYSGIMDTVMSSVSQTMMDSVIAPFLNSSAQAAINISQSGVEVNAQMTAGGTSAATSLTAGGMAASQALAAAVARIETMAEWMKSDEMQAAMREMQAVVGELSGSVYAAVEPVREMIAPMQSEAVRMADISRDTSAAMGDAAGTMQEAAQEAGTMGASVADAGHDFTDFYRSLGKFADGFDDNQRTLITLGEKYREVDVFQKAASQSTSELAATMADIEPLDWNKMATGIDSVTDSVERLNAVAGQTAGANDLYSGVKLNSRGVPIGFEGVAASAGLPDFSGALSGMGTRFEGVNALIAEAAGLVDGIEFGRLGAFADTASAVIAEAVSGIDAAVSAVPEGDANAWQLA
ncbi:MAG: hypothetical protein GY862_15235 [Gammaproteobacteria bacterium]|nr:hypothetical protein [Gammaproteobacteria bacterium]